MRLAPVILRFAVMVPMLDLSACTTTPYVTPAVPMTATFVHAGSGTDTAGTFGDAWWKAFGDPNLNVLVSAVLARNNNLAAAALQVRLAQDKAGLARLDQWPSFSGALGATTVPSTRYSANMAVAYEVDLWGKLADQTSAANWEVRATQTDRDAAALALAGATCELYWRIGFTHQQMATAQASLAYTQKAQSLVIVQHKAGAVSGVEVAEAEQSVEAQRANLTVLAQQLVQYQSSLTVLLAGVPWPDNNEPQVLPGVILPAIRAGLPAELLGRRPDLKAADLRLRESLVTVDAVRASFYPALDLTGSDGGTSRQLAQVLSHPTGIATATLSWPFLDFQRTRLNLKVSRASYDIAVLTFKQTLLQALADTDTALSNRTQLAVQGQSLTASLNAAKTAEAFYAVRYRSGSVALRIWLDAQESLRQAQLAYDDNRLSQFINQSTLYQALGGSA